ncbi:MAG TPA: hypothetical protein VFZ53_25330 [Polyangiaceae bacterium]
MGVEIVVRPWADLVFHVLAHVSSSTPASVYDPAYVEFAARYLGAPEARPLGADVRALAAFATNHARYAALQGVAWLFASIEEDERTRERDLSALGAADVADPALLGALRGIGPAVEVLRCAAELEAEAHARLPAFELDRATLEVALESVGRAAPALAGYRLGIVRSLRLRGRVRDGEIWIGAPGAEPGPELFHVAWQAAHEATVDELARTLETPRADDRPVESAALVLLAERAAGAGLADEHAAWFSHFGLDRSVLELSSQPSPWRDGICALLAKR